MLKLLRKKGVAKKFLWGLAIIIILSFGFLGTASLVTNMNQKAYAGEIFGRKILPQEFEKVYLQARIQAIITYGEKFLKSPNSFNLTAQAWDRLILMREAQKRKIKVNDTEVVKEIENFPYFQRDRQFDTLLYNDILRHIFRIRPRDFEEGIRDNLILSKLYSQETATLKVSDEEAWQSYKEINDKVQISYAIVNFDQFKNEVNVTEDEIKEFFENNKIQFLIPPTVNVEYMRWEFPEAIKDEEKEALRQKSQEIHQSLTADNFQDVAQKNNLTVQSTGFFSIQQPNLSLGWSYDDLNRIFELHENQLMGPMETPTGIISIKISQKKPEYLPELTEVKDKVTDALKTIKARDIAKTKAEEYFKNLKADYESTKVPDFAAIVKKLNLPLEQTPSFNRGQYLPKIGINKDFQDAAFSLNEENKVSGLVETSRGFCILYRDNDTPADSEKFKTEKDQYKEVLIVEKRAEAFTNFLTKLRLQSKLVDNVSKQNQI